MVNEYTLIAKRIFYEGETTQPSSLFLETKSKTGNKLDRQQESQDIPNNKGKFYKPRELPAAICCYLIVKNIAPVELLTIGMKTFQMLQEHGAQ